MAAHGQTALPPVEAFYFSFVVTMSTSLLLNSIPCSQRTKAEAIIAKTANFEPLPRSAALHLDRRLVLGTILLGEASAKVCLCLLVTAIAKSSLRVCWSSFLSGSARTLHEIQADLESIVHCLCIINRTHIHRALMSRSGSTEPYHRRRSSSASTHDLGLKTWRCMESFSAGVE